MPYQRSLAPKMHAISATRTILEKVDYIDGTNTLISTGKSHHDALYYMPLRGEGAVVSLLTIAQVHVVEVRD
jgi:hypothetical protein